MQCERIVAVGCSNTGGAELLDHELPDEYKPHGKWAQAWTEKLKTDRNMQIIHAANRARERKMAWPAQLARIMNLPFVSHADMGQSIPHSIWILQRMVSEGKIRDADIILIGCATEVRLLELLDGTEKVHSFGLDQKPTWWEYFTRTQTVWNYINNLKVIRDLRTQLHGRVFCVHTRNPVVIPPINRTNRSQEIRHAWLRPELEAMYRDHMWLHDTSHDLYAFLRGQELPGGHANLETHIAFAEYLQPKLTKKINQL